jgi:hypothetical protein
LGKFFQDTTTVFGSKLAPASFDPLPETVVNIVCTIKGIPKKWVHRQLDDVPIVSPRGSGYTEQFYKTYARVCKDLNVPLAENCPNHEKAFGPSTFGTVLGIGFDSEKMEWFISKEKAGDLQSCIEEFTRKNACTLLDIQVLHGKLSSFAQMSDFLMGFRYHLVAFLKKFGGEAQEKKIIPRELKDDLWIWRKAISAARGGLPLGESMENPPLFPFTFVSDAAGAAFEWEGQVCKNRSVPNDRGVATVGYEGERVHTVAIVRWPFHLLTRDKSRGGSYMGAKSGTLEMVGLLLPFLTIPQQLRGRHIVLGVDNTSVVYAWPKRYCKNDPETSLLIRTLHVLEAYLCCKIYVTHVKRMSTPMAVLADHLSRETTITPEDRKRVMDAPIHRPWGKLGRWLENPVLNWDLPLEILQDVKSLCDP